jgi:plasmid maintenance system antidote protein VapI
MELSELEAICAGEIPVKEVHAEGIARAIGEGKEYWLKLQADFDRDKSK